MTTENIKIPTIHLNGSSGESLLDEIIESSRAIQNAMETLAQNTPNARDYYIQDDSAFKIAKKQHDSRLEKLRSIFDELNEIANGIDKQL